MREQVDAMHVESFAWDVKRFHVPFVLRGLCPRCREPWVLDLSSRAYLSYPKEGAFSYPKEGAFLRGSCCQKCDFEWSVGGKLRVTLEDTFIEYAEPEGEDLTVVGMYDGDEVYQHVHCPRSKAWDQAVRQEFGDIPEDAFVPGSDTPQGYSGLCLAILPGHIARLL